MEMSPKDIVNELDKYIIGQEKAKHAVAVALRNRYRRSQLPEEMKEDITPKNIILKGPTGVGKTEIARRLAKLVHAPFVKVEATKFTEVGYVGRDVESIIRDLAETSIRLVKEEKFEEVKEKTFAIVNRQLVTMIFDQKNKEHAIDDANKDNVRAQIEKDLIAGKLDDFVIDIQVAEAPKQVEIMPGMGAMDLGDIMGGFFPQKKKNKKMPVKIAREYMMNEESSKFIDMDTVKAEAIRRCEQDGIVFIDEIDKVAGKGNGKNGPDVSREGVQRDILPIVEGSTVTTKYGTIKTDYILFIAAGAFHTAKVEDLIPELLGRFPIQVELQNLTKEDFVNILTNTKNSITQQYGSLLKVDNINLVFDDSAIDEIAEISVRENETSENIGARRLHTIMENLLESISFHADGSFPMTDVKIDRAYVDNELKETLSKYDLTKYIL